MFVGEGADQLEEFAACLEKRATGFVGVERKGVASSRHYYRGLIAGLQMAARASRNRAKKLRRAQRRAAAQNVD
jgi:hypothetical protein